MHSPWLDSNLNKSSKKHILQLPGKSECGLDIVVGALKVLLFH